MQIKRRAALLGAAAAGMAGRAHAAAVINATWNGWPESQVKPLFDAYNQR